MPVQHLARLTKRTPGSILLKMANIDGSRKNGARSDQMVGRSVDPGSELFTVIYRVIIDAAREVGIGYEMLPDFLELEQGPDFRLLGQETITSSAVEEVLGRELEGLLRESPTRTEAETETLFLMNVRRGQHRFAREVIHNCGGACVFCGMTNPQVSSQSLLIASHIKPWRHGDGRERLDFRNGVAACPTHDRAFDTGLRTLTPNLEVQLSPQLQDHIRRDPAALAAFGSPPLKTIIDLDWREKKVNDRYVQWHRERIFQVA